MMTKEEIIRAAYARLNLRNSFHIEYELYKLEQKKKMMIEIMKCSYSHTCISYSVLVCRKDYITFAFNSVSRCYTTLSELNDVRTKAVEDANRKMEDVPVYGYDNYAILHLTLSVDICNTSVNSLSESINDKNGFYSFLWFDFDPIIENVQNNITEISW